jgi:hypothetical protein
MNIARAAEEALQGEVIFKPLLGGATTRLLDGPVLAKLEHVRTAPVIFQQRIVGDDIRVVLVGEEVVSAAAIRTPNPLSRFPAGSVLEHRPGPLRPRCPASRRDGPLPKGGSGLRPLLCRP